VVFDSACKKLRSELKFVPSIAEVVAEIERQNRRWNKRFSALDGIEDCYEELVQLIAQSEVAVAAAEERRERERAAAEQRERQRKYREPKAAPLVVGDRPRIGTGMRTTWTGSRRRTSTQADHCRREAEGPLDPWALLAAAWTELAEETKGRSRGSRPS